MQKFSTHKLDDIDSAHGMQSFGLRTAVLCRNALRGLMTVDDVHVLAKCLAEPEVVRQSPMMVTDPDTPNLMLSVIHAIAHLFHPVSNTVPRFPEEHPDYKARVNEELAKVQAMTLNVSMSDSIATIGAFFGTKWLAIPSKVVTESYLACGMTAVLMRAVTELAFVIHCRLYIQYHVIDQRQVVRVQDSRGKVSVAHLDTMDRMRTSRNSSVSQNVYNLYERLTCWSASPLGLGSWFRRVDPWGPSSGRYAIPLRIGTDAFDRILKRANVKTVDMSRDDPNTAGLWALAQWWDSFNMQRTDTDRLLRANPRESSEDAKDQSETRKDPFGINYIITFEEWGDESAVSKIKSVHRCGRPSKPLIVQLSGSLWGLRTRDKVWMFDDPRCAVSAWIEETGNELEGGYPTPRLMCDN